MHLVGQRSDVLGTQLTACIVDQRDHEHLAIKPVPCGRCRNRPDPLDRPQLHELCSSHLKRSELHSDTLGLDELLRGIERAVGAELRGRGADALGRRSGDSDEASALKAGGGRMNGSVEPGPFDAGPDHLSHCVQATRLESTVKLKSARFGVRRC